MPHAKKFHLLMDLQQNLTKVRFINIVKNSHLLEQRSLFHTKRK